QGHVTIMNLDNHAHVDSTKNATAHVLSMSNAFDSHECSDTCTFNQEQNPVALANNIQMGFFNQDDCMPDYYACYASPGAPKDWMPVPQAGAFAASMLTDLRSTRAAPDARPCGVANVRLHRIYFQGEAPSNFAGTAVRVQHS